MSERRRYSKPTVTDIEELRCLRRENARLREELRRSSFTARYGLLDILDRLGLAPLHSILVKE